MDDQAACVAAKPGSISVALATYNGESFLPQQLKSIAGQKKLPDELVISDDASTDNTVNIINRFAKSARFPVVLLQNEKATGFRANFISCAGKCKSSLIAFCDQDDIWLPNKLAVQHRDFDDPCVMLSCHNADLIDRDGLPINRRLDQFAKTCRLDLEAAGPLVFPRGFTQMVRRDLFKWEWLRQSSIDIGEPSQIMSHDGWLFFVALLHGFAIYHEEPLASYRQHGENASGSVLSKRVKFKSRFVRRPAEFDKLAKVWGNRGAMLRLLLQEASLDPGVKCRVDQAIVRYEHSAKAAQHRHFFYSAPTRLVQTKLLLEAIGKGDFRWRDPWAFPIEGAVKDAATILFKS